MQHAGTLKNILGQAKGRRVALVLGNAHATQAYTRIVKVRQKATLGIAVEIARPVLQKEQ